MLREKKLAFRIAAAISLFGMVGAGYTAFAADIVPFPGPGNPPQTVKTDTVYEIGGEAWHSAAIAGAAGTEKVTLTNTHSPSNDNGIVLTHNALDISHLDTLQVKANPDKKGGGLTSWWGGWDKDYTGDIRISDVQHVILGTAEEPIEGSSPSNWSYFRSSAMYASGGYITMKDIGDLTLYSNNVGITAEGSNDPNKGTISIAAKGDIAIHAKNTGVIASAAEVQLKAPGAVSLTAEGKVSIQSSAGPAVQLYDEYSFIDEHGKPAIKEGTADTRVTIQGKQGITLQAGNDQWAVYGNMLHGGTASLNIGSPDGDVTISGGKGIYLSAKAPVDVKSLLAVKSGQKAAENSVIYGKNVNITTTEGSGISLGEGQSLSLKATGDVNQGNGNIRISATNGRAAELSGGGKLTIGDGTNATNVTVDGRIYIRDANSNVTFADKTTTYLDSKYLTGGAFIDTSAVTGDKKGLVTAEGNSKIILKDIKNGTTNFQFSDSADVNKAVLGKLQTDTKLQAIVFDANGNLVVKQADAATIHTALAGIAIPNVLTNIVGNADLELKNMFFDGDGNASTGAANAVANLGELAGFNHSAYTAHNLFTDAIGDHLTNAGDDDVWAYYVHNKESVDGLGLAGMSANYDVTYNGAVVGADLYRSGNTKAGIAASYISGSLDGSNRYASSKNDADYYGVSLYSRKDMAEYALAGDLTWLHGSNDITQWNSGRHITASPDVDSFSLGVKALKDISVGDNAKLTPYVGARYLRINTEGYSSNLGIHYDADSQNLFLLPVGVNYSADLQQGSWTVRPTVGVGYVWNIGDRSVDQSVSFGSGIDSFSYDTTDSGSFLIKAGVTAENADMAFGVGYEYQDGSSTSLDKWTVNASFKF